MNKDRGSSLPPSLPPLGLSREQAAEYIGVSQSKFDDLVAIGHMPPATRIGTRCVWDQEEVRRSFKELNRREEEVNPWLA